MKMDNSPYLTILHDGINNFLLHPTEEALELQDPNLKSQSIFTEIENVAKEWSVELPVLMEDQNIEESPIELHTGDNTAESTMGLASDLSNIYEETLTNSCEMVLEGEGVETEENLVQTKVTFPIEIPGKGFITAEGFFITNDLLLQLNLENNEELSATSENAAVAHEEQIALPQISHSINNNSNNNNNRSLIVLKQPSQKTLSNNKSTLINQVNIPLRNSNFVPSESVNNNKVDPYENWFEVISAHKCMQCGFLTEQRSIMIAHYRLKHLNEDAPKNGQPKSKNDSIVKSIVRNGQSQTIYICSVCSLGYGSIEKLKLHMILSHKLAIIPEELNAKVSLNNDESSKSPIRPEDKKKMQMSLLRQQAKASKRIKCSVKGCDLRFALDDMRARHERCHIEGQKQFKCSECGQKFSLWRLCSVHLWRCHSVDLGLLTCPMCNNFKASSTVRLVNHMAIHEDEKPYKCHCGKAFKQHSQKVNHQITHRDSTVLPEWASQQQCDICKKYFSNSKSLKKHVQSVHDKFKPFICSVCGHKTARKSMLKLHLRQHTGEKPHQCPICQYKTGDHNSLRRHFMRHSGRTKYSCPHCKYQSIQSTAYKNHIATKHPGLGGSYFCTICSHHTVNENAYICHMRDHEKGLIETVSEKNGNAGKNSNSNIGDKKQCSVQKTIQQEQIACDVEDDESHNYLSLLDHSNDAVDTGGITIPAGFEILK